MPGFADAVRTDSSATADFICSKTRPTLNFVDEERAASSLSRFDARLRYSHAVWHCFVAGGTGCHFFAVLGYAS